MTSIESRRIIGILLDVSEISLIDFTKTIENNVNELHYSIDGLTSIMWDVDDVGEEPAFITAIITRSRTFTYIELESIKTLGYWK
jgi:hypothetical protein